MDDLDSRGPGPVCDGDGGTAYLDLETRKVPAPAGFRMRNGEPLRNRWSVLMAGIASYADGIRLIESADSEESMLAAIANVIGDREAVYSATREFDEMILKGRFTNARRAHEPVPFYPAMPGAEATEWRNLRGTPGYPRATDVPSREVPVAATDGRIDLVLVHLLRDVCELVLADGNPDAECEAWCLDVLRSTDFAREAIFGDEPEA